MPSKQTIDRSLEFGFSVTDLGRLRRIGIDHLPEAEHLHAPRFVFFVGREAMEHDAAGGGKAGMDFR